MGGMRACAWFLVAAAVDAAPVKEEFNHTGGDEKEEKAEEVALQAGGKKSRKNRKNRNRNNKTDSNAKGHVKKSSRR